MQELILHHYDMSPYAEKVRLMFGLKGLAWRSVQIPIVMPKPDLTELTGGYRRTPTLQIGADVYCDTKVIARALERLHPKPSLFPTGDDASVWALARFGETSFMMVVSVFLGTGLADEAFIEDRKKMAPGVDFDRAPLIVPAKLLQLRANLDLLERRLADGRPFLLGDAVSYADLSTYHPLFMTSQLPAAAPLREDFGHVSAWMDRVAAVSHGSRSELDAKDAVEIARAATPAPIVGEPAPLPDGLSVGDDVMVIPEEVGSGVVRGELLATGLHEIAIRRRAERAGELVVHFPRDEYMVVRVG
jgi:glutathione S-transferase